MATQVTVYGGANEIGGNKILLEDGGKRCFFDFGKAFGRYGSYFDGVFIKERPARGMLDPISLGLVPPLRGLLREDLIPALSGSDPGARLSDAFWDRWKSRCPGSYRDLRRADGPAVDAVLLSHAHQDHIGDLGYVAADVPAASTRTTAFISKVLLDTGQPSIGGAPYVGPRGPTPDGMLQSLRDQPYQARPYHFFDGAPAQKATVDPLADDASFWRYAGSKELVPRRLDRLGGISVRHWPVDHSIPGATAYALETQAGWVGYTGDLRFHGARGAATWAFAHELAALRPAALLCEGTRLSHSNRATEESVFEECLRSVRKFDGRMVVADFAPRNVERLLTFLRIAGETDRRLVVQPRDAYLLRAMHLADPLTPDAMEDPRMALYADPKVRERDWEGLVRLRYHGRTVGPREVRSAPAGFILAFSLTDVADLLDVDYLMGLSPGGGYIFSNSPAYDDEQMVDLVRLWHWTTRLGMELVGLEPAATDERGQAVRMMPTAGYHASGHAGMDDLARFVQIVRPRLLIAIHTEEPQRWHALLAGSGIEVVQPGAGIPIPL
jgi:ribonuclease J